METYKTIRIWKLKTSKTELVDILKAWLVLSLAFALVFGSISLLNGNLSKIVSSSFIVLFLVSMMTAGIGFLFHELAHKFAAQHYGCTAEFRAFDQMLYLALGLAAVIGFIFAAPGAVMIAGRVTLRENGIISLAGPLTNFILAGVFLGLSFSVPILQIGFMINAWLGIFNLIPFGNFDGRKILEWNRYTWFGMVVLGIFLLFGLPGFL
ncbi:MAG: metalloprotease [Parcubacteria group bacterium]|nr:metalloprotease [Parcubacteria group bacterium]